MIQEAGVKMYFHCWVADVVMDGNAVRGVVLESKAGRQAILAKVVVDASGDGDVFAAAGAEHEQRLHAIGLVHRLGNADRADLAGVHVLRTLADVDRPGDLVHWERALRDARDERGDPKYSLRDWAAWVLTGEPD